MSLSPGPRAVHTIAAPTDPRSAERVLAALADALDGSGPALSVGRAPAVTRVADEVAVIVHTSGSTGRPRPVALTTDQVTALTGHLHGGLDPQWVSGLPWTSMGGLNVAIRSLATRHGLILVPPSHPFDPRGIIAALGTAAHPVFLSLVPTQLARILEADPAALRTAHCVFIGGGPMSATLRERSAHLPIVRTYGMTETAGGCVFDGVPAPGVGIEIDDGRVTVCGVTVAAGYLDTGEEFHGRFRTHDLGESTDGILTVTGRIDDVVVVRGTNVSLTAVADALAPASVCVVAIPDEVDGALICAAFTGSPDITALSETVVARLGPAARPRRTRILDALPLLHSGKVDRRAVQAIFEAGE